MTPKRIRKAPSIPIERPAETLADLAMSTLRDVLRIDSLEIGPAFVYEKVLNDLGFQSALDTECQDDGDVAASVALRMLVHSRLRGESVPLSRVSDWLRGSILPSLYGIDPDKVNEYRLGRLLDKVADRIEAIWRHLVVNAHRHYGLDLDGFVGDGSAMTFAGAHEGSKLVAKGKERDQKQLHLTMNVTSKYGIPVVWDVHSGNTTDCMTVCDNIVKLLRFGESVGLSASDIITWGDRGRLNFEIIREYHKNDVKYIGTLQSSPLQTKLIESYTEREMLSHPVVYSNGDGPQLVYAIRTTLKIPATKRGKKLRGVDEIDEPALVVLCPALRAGRDRERERDLRRVERRLEAISGYLNKSHYTKKAFAERQLNQALAMNSASQKFLWFSLEGEDHALTLTFGRRSELLDAERKRDGFYIVLFNCSHLSNEAIIQRLKGRNIVEQRVGNLKGVIAVSPVYLQNDDRLRGLMFICMVALLVESLVEMKLSRAHHPLTVRKVIEQFANHRASVVTMCDRSTVLVVPEPQVWQRLIQELVGVENGYAGSYESPNDLSETHLAGLTQPTQSPWAKNPHQARGRP